MPDPKQMAGIPRPVNDLPNATVSVRLIRGQLSNNIANFPVELHVGSQVRTVKTDEAGRADLRAISAFALIYTIPILLLYWFVNKRYGFRFHGGIKR